VAAVSAEMKAILLYKIGKILQFLCCFVNSAHDGQLCAQWPILCKILRAQNRIILTSLVIIKTKLIVSVGWLRPITSGDAQSSVQCLELSMLTFVILGLLSAARKSDKQLH